MSKIVNYDDLVYFKTLSTMKMSTYGEYVNKLQAKYESFQDMEGLSGEVYTTIVDYHTNITIPLCKSINDMIDNNMSCVSMLLSEFIQKVDPDDYAVIKEDKISEISTTFFDNCTNIIKVYDELVIDLEDFNNSGDALNLSIVGKEDLNEKFTFISDVLTNVITEFTSLDSKMLVVAQAVMTQQEEVIKAINSIAEQGKIESLDFSTGESFFPELDAAQKAFEDLEADNNVDTSALVAMLKGGDYSSTAFSPDPVNLSTGNFIYEKIDLEMEAGGSKFEFKRFYNSINYYKGTLGRDWIHNYEVSIKFINDGLNLTLADGSEDLFSKSGDKTFISLITKNKVLIVDGNYIYEDKDKCKYEFSTRGQLIQILDSTGVVTKITYNEKKLIEKAERENGEFYEFSYDEKRKLKIVKDHSGRTVNYEIVNNTLIAVIECDDRRYDYEYNNNKLSKITNPLETETIYNEYDNQRRVVYQEFPDGGSMNYEYDDVINRVKLTERDGNKVTYVHDDRFRDIKHIFEDGFESFEYNKKNQKTSIVDKMSNKKLFSYDEKGNVIGVLNALKERTTLQYNRSSFPTRLAVDGKEMLKCKYDENDDMILFRDALSNTTQFEYLKKGLANKLIKPDGSIIYYDYDQRGNVTTITDELGSVVQYQYDTLNRVTTVVDGNGNKTSYNYDQKHNITKVTNALGDFQNFKYDHAGKIIEINDFDGKILLREYNNLNKLSKSTDKSGRNTNLEYDLMWNISKVTLPDESTFKYEYNKSNKLSKVTDSLDNTITMEYDVLGNQVKEIDALGNETLFEYDKLNRLTKVTDPELNKTLYKYDVFSNLIQINDALENQVKMKYDLNHNLLKEVNKCGEIRTYEYNEMNKISKIISEEGLVTKFVYAPGGLLLEKVLPNDIKESYTYDNNRNIKTYTNVKGFCLTYTYDSLDRVIQILDSNNGIKSFEYDVLGNVTSMTNEEGIKTKYEYSLSNALTKVIDQLGNEVTYEYDLLDNLVSVNHHGEDLSQIDSQLDIVNKKNGSQQTRYERNKLGKITKIVDSLGLEEEYKYDGNGSLIEKIDKEGYVSKFRYTKNKDLSHVSYSDGKEVEMKYNALRQLVEVKDWLGSTNITCDANGRAIEVSDYNNEVVKYSYNEFGQKTDITYPCGKLVNHIYNELGQLSQIVENDSVINYTYDKFGSLVNKKFNQGQETNYSFDNKGQLSSIVNMNSSEIIDSYKYSYNLIGNKILIDKYRSDLVDETGLFTYDYDELGRLTSISKDSSVNTTYSYDAFGNRTNKVKDSVKTEYLYNQMNQLVKEVNVSQSLTKEYEYDKRGNLNIVNSNNVQTKEYFYNSANRLERATNMDKESKYQYNAFGQRVSLQVYEMDNNLQDPLNVVKYTLDLTKPYNNMLVEEKDGNKSSFIWDNAILRKSSENGEYNYQMDDIGSVTRLYDKEEMIDVYSYDEFGVDISKNQNKIQPFGFSQYQYDNIAENYFAQARQYTPEAGRFVSQDRVKGNIYNPITHNNYLYCVNDPVQYVDLDGNFVLAALAAILIAGAAAAFIPSGISSAIEQNVTGDGKVDYGQLLWDMGTGVFSGAVIGVSGYNPQEGINSLFKAFYDVSNGEDFDVISILGRIMEELKISKVNDGIGMGELEKDISNILGEYGVGEVKSLIANECIT